MVSQVQLPQSGAVPVQSDRAGVWNDGERRSRLQDCSVGAKMVPVNRKDPCRASVWHPESPEMCLPARPAPLCSHTRWGGVTLSLSNLYFLSILIGLCNITLSWWNSLLSAVGMGSKPSFINYLEPYFWAVQSSAPLSGHGDCQHEICVWHHFAAPLSSHRVWIFFLCTI